MNLASTLVAALVAILIIAIVISSVRRHRQGKSSCSCGSSCGGCGMSDICHSKDNNKV